MPPRRRVLLVDDDARTVEILARLLREDGFDVDVATGSSSAMQRLKDAPPDVLVTDLGLPRSDGALVVRYGRTRRPDLRVVLVTDNPELAAALQKSLVPAARVFTKPVDYGELRRELDGAQDTPA